MTNKLPEDLAQEVESAIARSQNLPYFQAQAALSVIAPHYEKQIAELKAKLEVKNDMCKDYVEHILELKAQIPTPPAEDK